MESIVIIRNNVSVETRGSVVVVKVLESNPYILRLLGTSCNTDTSLYVPTKSITLSLEKGKRGVVALSISSPDGRFYGRGMFEVKWVGGNGDKIFINLSESFSSSSSNGAARSFSMSDNGIDIYGEQRMTYRIPFVFWGDTDYYRIEKNALELTRRLESLYKIIRDGNTVCRYIAGDIDISGIEAAHVEYCMENPDFLKQVALKYVEQGHQINKLNDELTYKKNNLQEQFEVSDRLEGKIKKLKEVMESVVKVLDEKMTIVKFLKVCLRLRRSKAKWASKILSDGLSVFG
jgi:hypothetical protein